MGFEIYSVLCIKDLIFLVCLFVCVLNKQVGVDGEGELPTGCCAENNGLTGGCGGAGGGGGRGHGGREGGNF